MNLFLVFLASCFLLGLIMRRRSQAQQRMALLGLCACVSAGYYFFNWL